MAVRVVDADVEACVTSQRGEDIETAPAAFAFGAVVAIRNLLQLKDYELRHDEAGIEETRVHDVDNASVDEHACVNHDRAAAAGIAAELDIGDDEAEVVLGLEDETHCEVTTYGSDEQVEKAGERKVGGRALAVGQDNVVNDERHTETERVSDCQANQYAECHAGEDGKLASTGEDINRNHGHA